LGARLDASDVAQEVCLRLHRGFARFQGQTVPELLGWVDEILRNVVASASRHHGAEKRDAGAEVAGGDWLAALRAAITPPEQRAMHHEEAARLKEAVVRLPEPQRTVFRLRFYGQLPFAEISRQTGKSVGNARVLFLRATEWLRKEMEEHT